jgi:hypothetical protein
MHDTSAEVFASLIVRKNKEGCITNIGTVEVNPTGSSDTIVLIDTQVVNLLRGIKQLVIDWMIINGK